MAFRPEQISKALAKAGKTYDEVMQTPEIAFDIRIDGVMTRGQVKDNERLNTSKEQYTKTLTCGKKTAVKRGSYVEIQRNSSDTELSQKGIVITEPNETPIDKYFTALLFNTEVTRYRYKTIYNEIGDIIGKEIEKQDTIPCFVQKITRSERMLDSGIERDSVNELTTLKKWDIKVDDVLQIGEQKYKVNDFNEIDKDVCICYMTFYRA